MKLDSGHLQGIIDKLECHVVKNFHEDNLSPHSVHKNERGSFNNTTDNTELKMPSHLANSEINGNDVPLERMTSGPACSLYAVQTDHKLVMF
jgi:hypothetical protein